MKRCFGVLLVSALLLMLWGCGSGSSSIKHDCGYKSHACSHPDANSYADPNSHADANSHPGTAGQWQCYSDQSRHLHAERESHLRYLFRHVESVSSSQ